MKNTTTAEPQKPAPVALQPVVRPTVVHVWGGHGEGGLYINGKKVSDYYTRGQADIVEALGFEPETKRLNEAWYKDRVTLPENLDECELA